MPPTVIRGKQVLDGSIQRADLDVSTVGSAVVAKILQGANVTLSSTGGDAGTGDVTVGVPVDGYTIGLGSYVSGKLSAIRPVYNTVEIYDEFDSYLVNTSAAGGVSNGWFFGNGGTSASVASQTSNTSGGDTFNKAFGIWQVLTGAVASAVGSLMKPMYGPIGLGPVDLFFRVAFSPLPTAANGGTWRFGLSDNPTTPTTNSVGIVMYAPGGTPSWLAQMYSAGTATSGTAATSPAIVAFSSGALSYYKLQISIDAAAANVTFYVNGVSIGTLSTGIPTVQTMTPFLYVGNINPSAAVAHGFYVDKFFYRYQIAY